MFGPPDASPLVTDNAGQVITPVDPDSPPASPSPLPSPTNPPRVLTICLAEEPESLFVYGDGSLAQAQVLEAIYDGPIDRIGYQFQPVILEKLPNLADGDAALEPLAVQNGDWVVNDAGQLVQLTAGEVVRPFGCGSPECAVAWDGNPLEMAQLSANFTIKEGIAWSDGTPVSAADSVFSYELARQCQAENECGGLGLVTRDGDTVERTASYTALDERTVRWAGLPGYRDPNYVANFFVPMPEHQLGGIELEALLTADVSARQPMGWGAYAIESWVPGDHLRLRANPGYFRAGEGLPAFDLLIFRFLGGEAEEVLDPERLQNALLSGMCDLIDQSASETIQDAGPGLLNELAAGDSFGVHVSVGPVWEQADFGLRPISYDDGYLPATDRPDLFGDPRTRQGIALCMDRERIVNEVFEGLSSVPLSYLPPDHPLLDPGLPGYGHDPAAGAELLTQAGWTDSDGDPSTPRISLGVGNVPGGTPLQFTYLVSESPMRLEAAEILAESLGECGVQVDLVNGPANEIYAPGPEGPVFGRQFDMSQFAWESGIHTPCRLWMTDQIPGDPNLANEAGDALFPFGWGGVNASGYSNPEFDRACQAALEALPGEAGYAESHRQAQALFAAELPAIPLYFHPRLVVARPDLCNFTFDPSAADELWNVEALDYREDCRE